MSPPTEGTFFAQSGQRVIDWLATPQRLEGMSDRLGPAGGSAGRAAGVPSAGELLCVQEAGDLIYVPRLWGHAVLNLAQSVGAAVEFEQQ